MNLFACVAAIAAAKVRGQGPPRSRRRHDCDRQAARFRRRLRSRLRFVRAHPRGSRRLARALRYVGRSLRTGDGSRAVSCRQRLFLSRRRASLTPLADPYGQQYRLSRVRRPAGRDRGRTHYRGDRLCDRAGHARGAQDEPLPERPTHALLADRRRPNPASHLRGVRGKQRLCEPSARRARLERQGRGDPPRHCAHASKVRHQLHRDPLQSSRRARACLFGRVDPSQSRRLRDGTGPPHQGGPGRR